MARIRIKAPFHKNWHNQDREPVAEGAEHPLALHPAIGRDQKLIALLQELETYHTQSFFVAHLADRIIEYVTPSFQNLFGYSAEEFKNAGPDLLYSLVDANTIPSIIEKQRSYIQQAKAVGFDRTQVVIMEFSPLPMTSKTGKKFFCFTFCTALTYTLDGDLDLGIVLMARADDPNREFYKQKLREIKESHSRHYTHPTTRPTTSPLDLVHMTTERFDVKITYREREVLALLAKGLSTKEIAENLKLSIHTTETHRKKLLTKFEAKNSAELIKKASKVFWLE